MPAAVGRHMCQLQQRVHHLQRASNSSTWWRE
jgi:hypothetical protein